MSRTLRQRRLARGERAAERQAAVARPGRDLDESPLAWLRRRKDKSGAPMIDAIQFEAGERLRADYTFAELMPSVTMSWRNDLPGNSSRRSPGGSAADMRDNVLAARERVQRALGGVGPELAGILVDVCCHLKGLETAERDRGWPLRSAKVVLQLALTTLARHYGLMPVAPSVAVSRAPRHWGADGYRPSLDAWRRREAAAAGEQAGGEPPPDRP